MFKGGVLKVVDLRDYADLVGDWVWCIGGCIVWRGKKCWWMVWGVVGEGMGDETCREGLTNSDQRIRPSIVFFQRFIVGSGPMLNLSLKQH